MKKVGSRRIIKLIIQVSQTSADILRFIQTNIRAINRLGYYIVVEKIKANDHGAASILRERGITKVPAIIDADGTVIIGRDSIEKFFLNGINNEADHSRFSPGVSSAIDDVHAYMARGIMDGVERDNEGRFMINNGKDRDEDVGDEAIDDADRKMADFERRSRNRHFNRDGDIDEDMERDARRRNARSNRSRRREPPADDDRGDGGRPSRRQASRDEYSDDGYSDAPVTAPVTGNQLDDEMYKAWVNNLGSADY